MKRKYYVGVDLHKTVIQVSVVDSQGRPVRGGNFSLRGDSVESARPLFRRLRSMKSVEVAVEAIGVNRWFVDECRRLRIPVIVADPTKLRLKESGTKTDRRDAAELARRLFLGDLARHAKTYYPADCEYGHRKVLRSRHFLVQVRQSMVNQIRSLLNAYRLEAPRGTLYTGPSLVRLRSITMANAELQEVLDTFLDELEHLQESIRRLDRCVKDQASQPKAQLLQEMVPSVGPQTAATILAEFGDVRRFTGPRQAAAYTGLVPRVNNSADRVNHGRLSQKGNRELRWIFCQMAVRLLARDPLVEKWAKPRLRRMHKNKVRVALARRLAVGVYHVLRTGEVFDLKRCLAA